MTIYDIAAEAGVSIATISRVVNHKSGVGAATRRRVEELLARHGYVPSAIARGMMSKTMHTVAVLAVDVRVPNYARAVYIIERECSRLGYNVIVCNTGDAHGESLKYLEILKEKHTDGVILVGSVHNELNRDDTLCALLENTPVVVANGQISLPNACAVLIDELSGLEQAVEHLYQKGHRHMAFVKDMDTDAAQTKRSGYERAMRARGLTPWILETELGLEGGLAAARRVLAEKRHCSAILCGEDLTAAGVLKGVLRAGLRVPQDMAVVGYNNSIYARICEPQLTTVDNRPEEMALMSAQLLARMVDGETPPPTVTLRPLLVVGGST